MNNREFVKIAVGVTTTGLLAQGHDPEDVYSALLASAALVCVQHRADLGAEKGGKKDFKMHAGKAYERMRDANELIGIELNFSTNPPQD